MLIIKRILAFMTAAAVCFGSSLMAFAENMPAISAESAVLICDGEVLYEKNALKRLPMASTTKIMTAILTIENSAPDEVLEIAPPYCGIEGSSMYLTAGEHYTVRELLTGLMLASGNDAAMALAAYVGGSIESFVEMMNDKAAELGLTDTHFDNPSGLPSQNHYSTASDMARLMEYCMKNELFSQITAMKYAEIKNQYFTNHNKLLTIYNGCIGGKTGYTEAAGRCLVSCCEREGMRLICVTLNAPDDWNDHSLLYDRAYLSYTRKNVSENIVKLMPVFSGTKDIAMVRPEKDIFLLSQRGTDFEFVYELPPFVFAPVSALSRAGRLIIYLNGEPVAETELIFCESIPVRLPDGTGVHNDRKTSENHLCLGSYLPP